MTVYCPECYAENAADAGICAACKRPLAGANEDDYVEKLIWALRHPDPTVPPRAAWILGERREGRAVESLLALVRESRDMGALEAAVIALGKIGDVRAVAVLEDLKHTSFLRVRRAADWALQQLKAPAQVNRRSTQR